MKKVVVGLGLFLLLLVGCSKDVKKEIVIYNNKVEINDAMVAYGETYTEKTGIPVLVKSCGGGCAYAEQIKAEFQSDRQPDIFVIEGTGGYNVWKSKLLDLTGEAWIEHTDLAFKTDGKTYGFPVAVEAWGMAYNTSMLQQAGIDPNGLTSLEAYSDAFAILDSMKDDLGIDAVVSMAAGADLTWVTGLHNFNGYLTAGLAYGDRTVLEKLLNGEVDEPRLAVYADWVELLFQNADRAVLLTGNYDAQVGAFANQKTAFIHQGNWIDPWLLDNNVSFEMGYAPHAAAAGINDSIFIGAPSFYVINKDSPNIEAAKDYLNALAASPEGHSYMVEEAQMIPAFTNVSLMPKAPLSSEVARWTGSGKAYTWLQNDMPDGFGMGTLGPIFSTFAKGDVDKEGFINLVRKAINDLK